MDTLTNIRTFLTVVRAGSFSAAARTLDTVPSVITKRIDQLEHQLKVSLFTRTTRKLDLTEVGERYYPRFMTIVREIDDAFQDVTSSRHRIEEKLRIKCPTTMAIQYYGHILTDFQRSYPGIRLELLLIDRSVNPVEEGFDIAIGALPTSYANVEDIPLCPLPRIIVASPTYLQEKGMPKHPSDLIHHDCLTFLAAGNRWQFQGDKGPVSVDVTARVSVNDSHVLMHAVENHLGIAIVARHIAEPSLQQGLATEILSRYPVPDLWVKALVPRNRRGNAAVEAVISWLKSASQPSPPWEQIPLSKITRQPPP
ncbi:LysR family transcriptional regulator [Halomonas sp. KM-1]|uniref:LysR family transcriptional regulator n=1 Tax=Halomonas sp. KM-1 TaxID=590061 RepID=UPI00028965A9|nr:LysR family transcriptional regulator [Halomonas sp. KM-1]